MARGVVRHGDSVAGSVDRFEEQPPSFRVNHVYGFALACLTITLTACSGKKTDMSIHEAHHPSLTRADWDAAARRTVFFGHQSVGDNILDGVRQISQIEGWPALRIVELDGRNEIDGPALAHAKIGQNGDPGSKVKSFREALDAGVGQHVDIALMKFCFWDVRHDTNLDAVFAQYRDTMADLARRYPRVTFVHTTVPLVAADVDWRARVRRLLGMSTPTDTDNAARERLNQRIREQYGNRGVLLDIAMSEVGPGRASDPPQLAADFSSDGAHLNEVGRGHLAAAFIRALSNASLRTAASE